MDDLLQEFISETQETLEALAGEVVAWEADPTDSDRLDAIFRFFHTVKGSCGFLNLPRFERLSHAAEDVLSDFRAGKRKPSPAAVTAVLAVMDRIGELAEAVSNGDALPSENDELLIGALSDLSDEAGLRAECVAAAIVEEAPATPVATPRQASQAGPRTIRLPLSLIDQLMNGVSDMVLARNELSRKLRERTADPELDSSFERLSSCVADMRDAISKTRMQRVERLFAAIPRMVRDLGRDLGKRIDLTLEGGDVEMDREMVEMVVDPLTHIVRNSIDHGIETPERRRALGKPEAGRLRLEARQSGNQIVIEISDDGAGIDTDRLLEKAIAAGRLSPDAAARMSEEERVDLIFQAGLSTAGKVTSISGRGVGMDVVRANVERIGGAIALDNQRGQGLRITLRVPLTLTIIPGLIIRAGDLHFAIPRTVVVEILHDTNEMLTISEVGGGKVASIRSIRHSMIDLEDILGMEKAEQAGPRAIMVVRSASGVPFALGVSAVENHEELVIRPASPLVMATGVYAGMTLPDNGKPMLLLDAAGLAHAAHLPDIIDDSATRDQQGGGASEAVETVPALRFEELGGEKRLLKLSLIERVEDLDRALFGQSGGHAFVRLGDRLVPVVHDGDLGPGPQISALRIRDGEREACYPVAAVIDIVDMPAVPDMVTMRGRVSGVVVIEGEHLEVINPYALFADLPEPGLGGGHPGGGRCVLADAGDGWTRDILAPLLRQAGKQVLIGLPADAMAADDILLCTEADGAQAADLLGCRVVQLRRSRQPTGPTDRSIYRYDQAALLAAVNASPR